jgi:uncharacterized protein involved in exopolysaccharide biosynthesis
MRPSLIDKVKAMLDLETAPVAPLATVRQRVTDSYFERLTVYPVKKSRVIAVEFEAPEPELAAEVANAVAEAFVDLQQDAKRQSAVAATAWLEQEIERLRDRVAEAEQAVSSYRSGNELYSVGSETQAGAQGNLSTQQLSELNAELARARAARAEAEARAELVQTVLAEGGSLESAQEVLESPLIQRLRERQVSLRAQIVELSTVYLPGHPRIRSLQSQLSNLEGQIRQEAEKTLNALRTAARVAAARETSLIASLDQAKVAVSESNDQEIELRALEREAAAQRDLLESFLARYREAIARTDADYLPADARIISRAVAPQDPSYPKRTMMTIAAGVAAFLIGAAILLLREFSSGRAFRMIPYGAPAELAPVVVATRAIDAEARVVAASSPGLVEAEVMPDAVTPVAVTTATVAEPANDLATAAALGAVAAGSADPVASEEPDHPGTAELAEILANPALRVVLFAGVQGGEGSGDLAFAAASTAAQGKPRFLVMDIGMQPSEALGGFERPGVGDLLAGDAAFGEVIRRDDASRVHTIPMGTTENNPPLQRLQIVIGALSHTYDKVIVVADRFQDWPHAHIRPDLAVIVCGPDSTEAVRNEVSEEALKRGAREVLVARYTRGGPVQLAEVSAAA